MVLDNTATRIEVLYQDPENLIPLMLQGAERPITSTKFGPESAVLLHMLTRVKPDIPVIWVDTGYNTRATQLFAERLTAQLNLNLHVFKPLDDIFIEPPELSTPEHQSFVQRVKLEPFQRAIAQFQPDYWFTAIRREQTEHRATHLPVTKNQKGYFKVAPLLDWSEADMHDYLEQHGLPSESNYYDPTKGEVKRECGLHLAF